MTKTLIFLTKLDCFFLFIFWLKLQIHQNNKLNPLTCKHCLFFQILICFFLHATEPWKHTRTLDCFVPTDSSAENCSCKSTEILLPGKNLNSSPRLDSKDSVRNLKFWITAHEWMWESIEEYCHTAVLKHNCSTIKPLFHPKLYHYYMYLYSSSWRFWCKCNVDGFLYKE